MQNIENKYYKVYGYNVKSQIEIPELLPGDSRDPIDVTIEYNNVYDKIKSHVDNGKIGFFSSDESWMYIKDVAYYRMLKGNKIEVEPITNDKDKIKTFILGSSFGALLIQNNVIAIHGGAAVIDDKAIIITGESGAGKSTLISVFRKNGYKFLSDDVSVTHRDNDKIYVVPAYPQQKLCGDAVDNYEYNRAEFRKLNENRDKYAIININDFEVSPKELYGIFQISCSDEVSEVIIKEINGVEKLSYITKNIYRINFAEIMGIKKEYLEKAIDIAKKIKVYSIIRPNGKYTSEIQLDNIVKIIKYN